LREQAWFERLEYIREIQQGFQAELWVPGKSISEEEEDRLREDMGENAIITQELGEKVLKKLDPLQPAISLQQVIKAH